MQLVVKSRVAGLALGEASCARLPAPGADWSLLVVTKTTWVLRIEVSSSWMRFTVHAGEFEFCTSFGR